MNSTTSILLWLVYTSIVGAVFTGHANDLRRMRMSKKLQSPTVVFYAAKDRQTIAGVRKRRQLLAGVVFSSAVISIFLKFLANVSRIPGHVLLVICSQTCLKSFVICAGPHSRRARCRKIIVNPQTRSRQFAECLAQAAKFARLFLDLSAKF